MNTNTQTDTPETDAIRDEFRGRPTIIAWNGVLDHARNLERDRDAALRKLTELRKDKTTLLMDLDFIRNVSAGNRPMEEIRKLVHSRADKRLGPDFDSYKAQVIDAAKESL